MLAIAAAQDLKVGGLVQYINTLHLDIGNFDQVRGEFPVEFLHQFLSTLALYTLERYGDPGLQSLVQIGGTFVGLVQRLICLHKQLQVCGKS